MKVESMAVEPTWVLCKARHLCSLICFGGRVVVVVGSESILVHEGAFGSPLPMMGHLVQP